MSLRREEGETLGERVRKLRESLPPDPALKRPKKDHASQEYFAKLVGASDRQRVISWERGGEPDARYRERMAELSGGVYSADDFAKPRAARAEVEARVLELERAVAAGGEEREDLRAGLQDLRATVATLTEALRAAGLLAPPRSAPARKATGTGRGARKR